MWILLLPAGAFPLSQLLGLTIRHKAGWEGKHIWVDSGSSSGSTGIASEAGAAEALIVHSANPNLTAGSAPCKSRHATASSQGQTAASQASMKNMQHTSHC
jgi:hypothetical protein